MFLCLVPGLWKHFLAFKRTCSFFLLSRVDYDRLELPPLLHFFHWTSSTKPSLYIICLGHTVILDLANIIFLSTSFWRWNKEICVISKFCKIFTHKYKNLLIQNITMTCKLLPRVRKTLRLVFCSHTVKTFDYGVEYARFTCTTFNLVLEAWTITGPECQKMVLFIYTST